MSEIENNIIQIDSEINSLIPVKDKIFTIVDIGQDTYAFDSKNVLEIIKLIELSKPEKLPSHVLGLFEYDGRVISVIDIKSILDIEREPYDINSMVVVLKVGENVFGVIVNKVTDIKRVELSKLQSTPYNSACNFIECIYNDGNFNCGIISLEALSNRVFKHVEESGECDACELLPKDEKSLDILHKRKLEYLEKTNKNPYTVLNDNDEFVSFFVGENRYSIKMNDIRGFYKLQETKMTKVPCTPDFILGLVNIKGDFICVVDIKNYFHSQKLPYSGSGTIIILDSDEFKIGILADAIGDNIQIKPDELRLLKKQEGRSEITQYVKDNEIYLVINVPDMLSNDKLFIR